MTQLYVGSLSIPLLRESFLFLISQGDEVVILKDSNGQLALQQGRELPLRVLTNPNGKYYIGTFSEVHGPFTRESREYWDRAYKAEEALANGTWTQRQHL